MDGVNYSGIILLLNNDVFACMFQSAVNNPGLNLSGR